jgi:hypothetical protein
MTSSGLISIISALSAYHHSITILDVHGHQIDDEAIVPLLQFMSSKTFNDGFKIVLSGKNS